MKLSLGWVYWVKKFLIWDNVLKNWGLSQNHSTLNKFPGSYFSDWKREAAWKRYRKQMTFLTVWWSLLSPKLPEIKDINAEHLEASTASNECVFNDGCARTSALKSSQQCWWTRKVPTVIRNYRKKQADELSFPNASHLAYLRDLKLKMCIIQAVFKMFKTCLSVLAAQWNLFLSWSQKG